MWRRNLLLIAVCVLGGGAVAGSLLRADRPRAAKPSEPAGHETTDFGETIAKIDEEFQASWRAQGVASAPRADDLQIARRLSLGLTGTIPSLEEIRTLEAQPPAQRLDGWLSHLLGDRRTSDYLAERLARAFVGTENGPVLVYRRRRFVSWLSDRLHENTPYDVLVRQLISDTGLWTDSPAVNFITVTLRQGGDGRPDEARLAARTSRAFLGVRLDCVECHDDNLGGPWLQRDFHALAAFYSEARSSLTGIRDQRREYSYQLLHRDREEIVQPAVPFASDLLPTQGTRRQQLSAWVTDPGNKAFARAAVNRMWALMFGRPMIEPIDSVPLKGSFPPGLETLADDFVRHGYDLRRMVRLIASTQVFQQDSRADFEITEQHEKHWAVFPLTRLRPEQMAGALLQASSLTTIDADSNILVRLARFGQERDFVQRYGDFGDDEFGQHGGTIPQRLLVMNGQIVKERTEENLVANAATKIAVLAPDDGSAVDVAYLTLLSRPPTAEEREHFAARLAGTRDHLRNRQMEDVCWTLLNSTEFAWNH
jgi:hypothetical protein